MPVELVGAKAIADYLYVGRPVVAGWMRRNLPGLPPPYAIVRLQGGAVEHFWLPSTLPLWARWYVDWQSGKYAR
jgi:hypothetical protein